MEKAGIRQVRDRKSRFHKIRDGESTLETTRMNTAEELTGQSREDVGSDIHSASTVHGRRMTSTDGARRARAAHDEHGWRMTSTGGALRAWTSHRPTDIVHHDQAAPLTPRNDAVIVHGAQSAQTPSTTTRPCCGRSEGRRHRACKSAAASAAEQRRAQLSSGERSRAAASAARRLSDRLSMELVYIYISIELCE